MQLSETGKTIRYFYNQNFWKIDRVKKRLKLAGFQKMSIKKLPVKNTQNRR